MAIEMPGWSSNDVVETAIYDFLLVFSALLHDLNFQILSALEFDLSRPLGV